MANLLRAYKYVRLLHVTFPFSKKILTQLELNNFFLSVRVYSDDQ